MTRTSRRLGRLGLFAPVVVLFSLLLTAEAQQAANTAASAEAKAALRRGEWPAYAGTYASEKYSPLDQINAVNVATLAVAWRWRSPDHAIRAAHADLAPSFIHEATPLMVNGVLYTSTSLSQVVAIDAATGQTKWVFDPGVYQRRKMATSLGWVHRGVAYWRDGADWTFTDAALRGSSFLKLPGILRWALEGCLTWQKHGLACPKVVMTATAEYRSAEDRLGAFFSERCQLAGEKAQHRQLV